MNQKININFDDNNSKEISPKIIIKIIAIYIIKLILNYVKAIVTLISNIYHILIFSINFFLYL
jgi:hypothetical protein